MRKALFVLLMLAIAVLPHWGASAKQLHGKVSASGRAAKGPKITANSPARARLVNCPVYKQAIGYFQEKNYHKALDTFFLLDSTGFCCDLVHYYIAQCYQNTGQTATAQMHYDWVRTRSKDPALVSYAQYANQTIAYYQGHRTYAGQGNNFDNGPRSFGGGGGYSRSSGFG